MTLPRAHVPATAATRLRRAAPWLVAAALVAVVLAGRAAWSPDPLERLAPAPAQPGDPPGTQAYLGSLHLPRGGPYVIGFWSPRLAPGTPPARLAIDGQRLVTGRGLVVQRMVLPAGAVTLRFAAPPDARLIWHPPGRRGDPEYVPASSLSPDPAARARFDRPGAARADALAAWLIVLIAIATIGWVRRDRLLAMRRDVLLLAAGVLVVAAGVRLWDLGAQGQTWDEDTYWSSGRNYVQNAVRGDFGDDAWHWNYEHPPVSKYLAGLGGLGADDLDGARAMSALVMALGCALLVPIGLRATGDLRLGAAAGAIAALSPHLVAHGQIVGHEAPSIAIWALAAWASLRVWDEGDAWPAVGWRLATVGVVLGVALMIRFVNGLAAPAIGLTILATAPRGARLRAIGWGLAIIPLVAVVTAIALWPRLWSDPIGNLTAAWEKLRGTHSKEPFFGTLTAEPPRWYFLAYLGATTPLGVWLAALGGLGAWLATPGRRVAAALAVVWMLVPLGVMASPVRQDGVRYVLPALLPIALLAAGGTVALAGLLARLHRAAAVAAPAAIVAYLAITCARIHPYYLDYYGEQVGGTAGVARDRRFEVAWWGEGLAEAIAHVNAHAAPGARVHRDCVEPTHLTWFRGDLWEPVSDPRLAAWIVHYQPAWRPCPIPPDARRVLRVTAGGAPLADVWQRDVAPRSGP